MTKDNKVRICKGNEPYEDLVLTPLPYSEPPAYFQGQLAQYFLAFYPLIHELYETIAENKNHLNLPTIEDGHQVQRVMDV